MTSDESSGGGPRDLGETRVSQPDETTFGSGRYVVKRLLGEGVQKTVYLVHDTQLGRDCALSLLRTDDLQADDRRGTVVARGCQCHRLGTGHFDPRVLVRLV